MLRTVRFLVTATALAVIAPLTAAHATARAGAPVPVAQDSTKKDKPVTPKQVGKNVRSETHRVGARTRDEAHKIGTQTNKQAKRTGKSVEKLVSRKARHDMTR